jgi:hypothetical protein
MNSLNNIFNPGIMFRSVSRIKAIIMLVMVGLSGILSAQTEQSGKDHNEQVTIIGTYDPSINEAFKINSRPDAPMINVSKPDFNFQTIETSQPTKITLQPIKPATIRAERRTKSYNNSIRAGFGSWITPYFDFNHGSTQKNKQQLNARIYHLSSHRNIPEYSPSPFSNTLAEIGFKRFTKTHIFSIGAGFALNTNRYYGFKPVDYEDITINEDSLKQRFVLARINLGLKSNYKKDDKLHHLFNIDAYYYFDRYQTSESFASFNFDLHKSFDVSKKLNYQNLGLEGGVYYYGNRDSVQNTTDVLVDGTPYFKARYGIVNFFIGLKFSYVSATTSLFAFNPILNVNLNIVENSLSIYAGVDGGLERNSYLKLSTLNPWVSSVIPLKWQQNTVRAYGGLRGNIARQLGFNIEVSWLLFKDMAYFVNTTDSQLWPANQPLNKFTAVYDKGNRLTVSGELSYTLAQDLKIWLDGEYNIYSLDSLPQPYHKPISSFGLGASYLIKKKVNIWVEVIGYGKRYAVDLRNADPAEITLDGIFDLNAGIEYHINEKFSAFLTGTNLLNSNYERFYNYPVQGLQVMIGVSYKF